MSKRDLLLMLNIAQFLSGESEDSDAQAVRGFAHSLEELLGQAERQPHQQKRAAASPAYEGHSSEESEGGSETEAQLRKKVALLEEQISSTQQMIEMTLNHVESAASQSEGERQAEKLVGTALSKMLDHSSRLAQAIPESFAYTKAVTPPSNAFYYVAEKFGVTYLIMVGTPMSGLSSGVFALLSNLSLNGIVNDRRYAGNASMMLEAYERQMADLNAYEEGELRAGVLIFDRMKYEVEFAGQGMYLTSFDGATKRETVSGVQNETHVRRRFGEGRYKIHRFSLKVGSTFYCSTYPPDLRFADETGERRTLEETLGVVAETAFDRQQHRLEQLLRVGPQTDNGPIEHDLMLVGLKF